jgi:hypothetical protein
MADSQPRGGSVLSLLAVVSPTDERNNADIARGLCGCDVDWLYLVAEKLKADRLAGVRAAE